MVPALAAWAIGAWLLGQPTGALVGALGGGAAALVGGLWAGRRRRTGRVSTGLVLALTGVAVMAVSGCALGARAVQHAGPVHELAEQGAMVQVRGTVLTQPRRVTSLSGEEQVVLRLRIDEVTARGEVAEVSTPTLVFAPPAWRDTPWRSQVDARARLAMPRQDTGSATKAGGVAVLSPVGAPVLVRDPPGLLRSADHVRERLRHAVDPLPQDARGLIPGLVIGDTSLTPPDLSEAMLETGMSHLSAVSGSNVAIVLGAVVLLCRWLGVPRRWRAPLGALALVGFVVLCRPEPSVLRAGVMGLIGLAGLSAARRSATVPALAATILALLCIDPTLARSYGFALSCVATLGLVVFARPWADVMARGLPPRAAVLGEAVAIPLAAQVVCAPIIVLLQGDIALVAVLANLLAAPMVAFTTVAGITVAITAALWLPLGSALAWLAALPAGWIAGVARVCQHVPYGHLDWMDGATGAWALTALTLLLVLAAPWLGHHLRRGRLVAVCAGALLLASVIPLPTAPSWEARTAVVVACDVGQGDAFVVPTAPQAAVLVDVGPEGGGIVRCLQDLGVTRIEAVVLSHFHADHVGGLEAVLTEFEVQAAYLSPVREPKAAAQRAHTELQTARVPLRAVQAGDLLDLGSVQARVLWPRMPISRSTDSLANNSSLVLDVRTSGVRILFTGDIEAMAAARVRAALRGQRFDVLKVPHHGSADQDSALIRGSGASIALIGVGLDNTFGHPTPGALALLRQSGMRVARTDRDGDVMVVRTEQGLAVATRSTP